MSSDKEQKQEKQLSSNLKRKLNLDELCTSNVDDSSKATQPALKRTKPQDLHSAHFIKVGPLGSGVSADDVRALFEPFSVVSVEIFWMDIKKETKVAEDNGETFEAECTAKQFGSKRISGETVNEGFALVGFKEEADRDSAAMFEGELSGKTVNVSVFYPRAQRIGLFVCGYPADTKKVELKEKIEGVTGPCEDFEYHEKYTIIVFKCLKEASAAREKIRELSLTCDYETTDEMRKTKFVAQMGPKELEQHLRTVYVRNIPAQTKEDELRAVFEGLGEIVSMIMSRDTETQACNGFAFIEFEDKASTDVIVKMAKKELKGTLIEFVRPGGQSAPRETIEGEATT